MNYFFVLKNQSQIKNKEMQQIHYPYILYTFSKNEFTIY
jgi:hypothetical protein